MVDVLNEKFPYIGNFNACKPFSPNFYPIDNYDQFCITQKWLEKLLKKSLVIEREKNQCHGKYLELVETMQEMIPNKSLFEAWEFSYTTHEWSTNWPTLIQL